jgi:hypothetical protein
VATLSGEERRARTSAPHKKNSVQGENGTRRRHQLVPHLQKHPKIRLRRCLQTDNVCSVCATKNPSSIFSIFFFFLLDSIPTRQAINLERQPGPGHLGQNRSWPTGRVVKFSPPMQLLSAAAGGRPVQTSSAGK